MRKTEFWRELTQEATRNTKPAISISTTLWGRGNGQDQEDEEEDCQSPDLLEQKRKYDTMIVSSDNSIQTLSQLDLSRRQMKNRPSPNHIRTLPSSKLAKLSTEYLRPLYQLPEHPNSTEISRLLTGDKLRKICKAIDQNAVKTLNRLGFVRISTSWLILFAFCRYGLTEFLLGHIESAGGVSYFIRSIDSSVMRSTIHAQKEKVKASNRNLVSESRSWIPVNPGGNIIVSSPLISQRLRIFSIYALKNLLLVRSFKRPPS
jgi:hypothetical protein